MANIKGTKTEQNLLEAFAGESMARNKYTYFASRARKDGYVQIAELFEKTAANEKEHAKMWFKLLEGGSIQDTATNLLHAAEGENAEWTDMYARMADEADAEGCGICAEAHKSFPWWIVCIVEAVIFAGVTVYLFLTKKRVVYIESTPEDLEADFSEDVSKLIDQIISEDTTPDKKDE